MKSDFEESIWCNINVSKNNNLLVGSIYRSPKSGEVNNEKLLNLMYEISNIKHDNLIITGDFNLKQINWELREVGGLKDSYQNTVFNTIDKLITSF